MGRRRPLAVSRTKPPPAVPPAVQDAVVIAAVATALCDDMLAANLRGMVIPFRRAVKWQGILNALYVRLERLGCERPKGEKLL